MHIINALKTQNEWWTTERVPSELLQKTKREEFETATKLLDDNRITAIIGPRRTGKTTLLYQLIQFLLGRGIEKERILFFSMDDPSLRPFSETLFEDILNVYFDEVLVKPKRKEKVYVFIDEIHFYQGWEKWLKKYYDLKYPIKFIVSSSSATHLSKKSKESLLGRIIEIILLPLNFRSYLLLSEKRKIVEHYKGWELERLEIKNKFELLKYEEELKILFRKYLLYGGFPEALKAKELSMWHEKLISDVMRKVLYRDLVELYGIRTPSKLEDLFIFLTFNTSETFSYSSISRNLGISIESVINYVGYLIEAYLIGELKLFSKSIEKTLRADRKYFLTDPGIQNAVTKTRDLTDVNIGLLVESVVQKHLYTFSIMHNFNLYYWKDKQEVDIIMDTRRGLVPIEVKYKSQINKTNLKGLLKFMEKFKVKKGIVVTKDLLDKRNVDGKEVLFIPAWLFLLSV